MRRKFISIIACLSLLVLLFPTCSGAQQVPQSRKWVALNPKYVEFSSSGIRFLPRDTKKGADSVTTKLRLPDGQPWRVAFDVQMVAKATGV